MGEHLLRVIERCVKNRTRLQPGTELQGPSKASGALPLLPTESSENISIYANGLEMQRFYSLPLEVVILIKCYTLDL